VHLIANIFWSIVKGIFYCKILINQPTMVSSIFVIKTKANKEKNMMQMDMISVSLVKQDCGIATNGNKFVKGPRISRGNPA